MASDATSSTFWKAVSLREKVLGAMRRRDSDIVENSAISGTQASHPEPSIDLKLALYLVQRASIEYWSCRKLAGQHDDLSSKLSFTQAEVLEARKLISRLRARLIENGEEITSLGAALENSQEEVTTWRAKAETAENRLFELQTMITKCLSEPLFLEADRLALDLAIRDMSPALHSSDSLASKTSNEAVSHDVGMAITGSPPL